MNNLINIKNQKINENTLIELLFVFFPISFIIGNLALSLNLLLFLIISLFVIKKNNITLRFKKYYWFPIVFFSYLFINTYFQFSNETILGKAIEKFSFTSSPVFKSIILIRFVLLIFVVDILLEKKILNLGKFFLSSLICTSFVSFDVIFQFIFGYDVFGFKGSGRWNSGPFNDEFIAGSYLQKFSLFSIFYLFEILKNTKANKLLISLIISFHLIAVLLAGNKMPLILFLFSFFLIFISFKNLRQIILMSTMLFLLVFAFLFQTNDNIKNPYIGFAKSVIRLINIKPNQNLKIDQAKNLTKDVEHTMQERTIYASSHKGLFKTALIMWKEKPITGYGLKSFRFQCWNVMYTSNDANLRCSTHPHNYYMEILAETGIIGLVLLILFFIFILKNNYKYIKEYNIKPSKELNFILPIILVIFIELWPLKSTGSFFSTWNATFFWLTILLLNSFKKVK